MAAIIIYSAVGLAVGIRIVVFLYRTSLHAGARLIVFALLLSFSGFIISVLSAGTIDTYLEMRSWPSVGGTILSSDIAGIRAFRPEITYEYIVNNTTYKRTTDLQMPSFGGRTSKLDVATKLAGMYPIGTEVTVFYEPADPGDSRLKTGVPVEIYLRLALGFFLLSGGISLVLCSFPRKKQSCFPRLISLSALEFVLAIQ